MIPIWQEISVKWCATEKELFSTEICKFLQWFSKSALLREIWICITMADILLPKCLLFIQGLTGTSQHLSSIYYPKQMLPRIDRSAPLLGPVTCGQVQTTHIIWVLLKKLSKVTVLCLYIKGMTVEEQHCLISLARDKLTAACW